jgi:Phosphotransferase enzyme family
VNDSIFPSTTPHTVDFGFVQGAWRRIEAMRSNAVDSLEPPIFGELEQALGQAVKKCDLLAENWRNRIYRIELAHGRLVVGKQLVMGTDAMLQCQYDQLRVLGALHVPGLGVPNTFALLPAKRLLLTEFVPGKTIELLAWTSEDVIPACDLAGKTLARLQLARTESISPIPVEMISRDLAMAPWRLSLREKEILQATLERLAAAEVRIGHVYYDYKPANLIYQNDELLFLIDPPDVWWRGVHLWDYACFRSSMRRHLWRISLRRPYDRHRRTILRQSLAAFEEGYLTSFANRHPEPPLFALAVQLFELQRNAVLITWKKGKVNMARQVNRITLPLLEMEKRWLFRRLARELPR